MLNPIDSASPRMGNDNADTGEFDLWMGWALDQAKAAAAAGEVPIGSVLLEGGAVIGSGFNQPISSNDPTAHAEVIALREAAVRTSNYRLPGTTLVVTIEPCLMCAGAMVNARVSRVIFGAQEPKWGAFGSCLDVGKLSLNHGIEVVAGVRAKECGDLLKDFFRTRRE